MPTQPFPRLAVGASGTGSLFRSMIQKGIPITLLFADQPCMALEIAEEAGIRTLLLPREGKFNPTTGADEARVEYTNKLETALHNYSIELIALAGFETVLAESIFIFYENRILNSHPALLPLFKGKYAVRDALQAGVPFTGTTIHIATGKLDDGPILAQAKVPILPTHTVDTLWEDIKVRERELYPAIIEAYASMLPDTTENTYERSLPLTRGKRIIEAS